MIKLIIISSLSLVLLTGYLPLSADAPLDQPATQSTMSANPPAVTPAPVSAPMNSINAKNPKVDQPLISDPAKVNCKY
jgi:hypothetical protein